MKVRIDDIIVGDRYRRDLGDVDALTQSIADIGLLHPIVVTPGMELVCGQPRTAACRKLGWTHIEANVVDIVSIVKGEFAENEQREELTRSERVEISKAIQPEEGRKAKERRGTLNRPEVVASEKSTGVDWRRKATTISYAVI